MGSDLYATDFVVVGAGLAAAACAYSFAQRGFGVTVLSMGGGASELPVGLMAAHLSVQDLPASQLSRTGVACTLAHCRTLLTEGLDWQSIPVKQCLPDSAEKAQRLRAAAASLPHWYELQGEYILHLQAAWIKPQRLVQAWLSHPAICVRQGQVLALRKSDLWQAVDANGHVLAQAANLVVAAGVQSATLLAECGFPIQLNAVGGAVAFGAWKDGYDASAYNGNGHFIGAVMSSAGNEVYDGSSKSTRFWLSGSTYERQTSPSSAEQDKASLEANHQRLSELLPCALFKHIDLQFSRAQVQSWRGQRCTSADRMPVVGQVTQGLYVTTAMGSRGLSYAAICAQILADLTLPCHSSSNAFAAPLALEWAKAMKPSRKATAFPSTMGAI